MNMLHRMNGTSYLQGNHLTNNDLGRNYHQLSSPSTSPTIDSSNRDYDYHAVQRNHNNNHFTE